MTDSDKAGDLLCTFAHHLTDIWIGKESNIWVDIPGGLTKPFRALWSTGLCRQLGKSN
jgi:hypothetical protein